MHKTLRRYGWLSKSSYCKHIDTERIRTRRTTLIESLRRAYEETKVVSHMTREHKEQPYLLVMSRQSESDKLKCWMNFNPFDVQSISLLNRFVILTKKQLPMTTRKAPNGSETLFSSSCFDMTPNASKNDEVTSAKSVHIALAFDTFSIFWLNEFDYKTISKNSQNFTFNIDKFHCATDRTSFFICLSLFW